MIEFKFFRFTMTVGLSFASYQNGRLKWEESQRYEHNSVHMFKAEQDEYGSRNLTTPDGRLIPGVPQRLLKEVDAPSSPPPTKSILESFPAPVPGIRNGNSWYCPESFNSIRIVLDIRVCSQIFDCPETPVAYLCLTKGGGRRYELYYHCSYFGVPRRKVAKA